MTLTRSANPFLDDVLAIDRRHPDLLVMKPEERHCSHLSGWGDGYVHHSALAALGVEAAWQVLYEERAVAAQVNALLIAPGRLEGKPLEATGNALRVGRSALQAQAHVTQEGKTLMVVTASFVRLPQSKAYWGDPRTA